MCPADVLVKMLLLEDQHRSSFEILAATPALERAALLQNWEEWAHGVSGAPDEPQRRSPPRPGTGQIRPPRSLVSSWATTSLWRPACSMWPLEPKSATPLSRSCGGFCPRAKPTAKPAAEALGQRLVGEQRAALALMFTEARRSDDATAIVAAAEACGPNSQPTSWAILQSEFGRTAGASGSPRPPSWTSSTRESPLCSSSYATQPRTRHWTQRPARPLRRRSAHLVGTSGSYGSSNAKRWRDFREAWDELGAGDGSPPTSTPDAPPPPDTLPPPDLGPPPNPGLDLLGEALPRSPWWRRPPQPPSTGSNAFASIAARPPPWVGRRCRNRGWRCDRNDRQPRSRRHTFFSAGH